jgi:uncharacterized protein YndB with AHSA1/START domain
MAARDAREKNLTTMERTSDRESTVTRIVNAPPHIVFEAWTNPEHFKRWWTPKSYGMTIHSCEIDARTGGSYKLMISHPAYAPEPMPFYGRYLEVTPPTRLVWTNEEGGEAGPVTTVTFEEKDGRTVIVMRDTYPSKEAFDAAIESGSASGGFEETFDQLEDFLARQG